MRIQRGTRSRFGGVYPMSMALFGLLLAASLSAAPAASEGDEQKLQQALKLLLRHQAQIARLATEEVAPDLDRRSLEAEPLVSPTSAGIGASAAPGLGPASLSLDGDLYFGSDPQVFKDGQVLLWSSSDYGHLAAGYRALASEAGGARNTAIGVKALTANTYGKSNTAVGYASLRDNTQGDYNTAVGAYSLGENETGNYNTAVGESALQQNSTGHRNTALGINALYANTTGSDNTAVGSNALQASYGDANTAVGYRALDDNTSGSENTAFGFRALYSSQDDDRNVALGQRALFAHTGGGAGRNTAAGRDALDQLASGSVNVALGDRAGDALTSGSGNIFIGSGVNGAASESDTIRIGAGTGTGSNQQNQTFIVGIRGTTTDVDDAIPVLIDSAGQLGLMGSSRRLKQDIQPLDELSERLGDLEPVTFRYRQHAARDPDSPVQFGLVAEQVAEVFPDLVVDDATGSPETVKYHLLEPLLLRRLQALTATLERQRLGLDRQQEQLEAARSRLMHATGVQLADDQGEEQL